MSLIKSPDLELSPLHFAILQRSMDRVLQHLEKFPPQDETPQSEYTFKIMECAIGWQSGLEVLSESGYQLDDALNLAIFRGDLNSLQTLLSSESYLPNSSLRSALCLHCWKKITCSDRRHLFTSTQYQSSFKQEIMKHFVNAIKSRRKRLLSLALSKLSETAVRSLNLDSSQLLDTDAPTIADMLRKNGIKLPVCLNPGKTPVFHSFHMNCTQGSIQLANTLYDNGFTEIDAPDNEGLTPLQRLVGNIGYKRWWGPDALAIRWLVEHGADVNKPFGQSRLPLIFDLASIYNIFDVGRPYQFTVTLQGGYKSIRWDWKSDSSLHQLLLEGGTGSR